jgi:hypothetical protein
MLRTITATTVPPVIRPDALLKRASEATYFGDNQYGTDGSNQLRTFKVKRGKVLSLVIAAQNDGDTRDSFTITGCGPSRGYKVTYSAGATDVTQPVLAGTFTTEELDPTDLETIDLTIKVTKRAPKAKPCSVILTSTSDTSVVDVVVARIKPR